MLKAVEIKKEIKEVKSWSVASFGQLKCDYLIWDQLEEMY